MQNPEPLQTTQRPQPQLSAFLGMGFRPLYPAGTFWAAASIGIWIFAPRLASGTLAGPAWHAHEMLWGFVATMAVGFLMTAGATWTGINPMHGKTLALACLLWAIARIGFLCASPLGFVIAAASELTFFALAAAALGRAVHTARNRRNYGIPWLVLALGAADGLYLLAAWQGDYSLLMQRFDAGLLCMAVIALLITRRVIPFFAMRAVEGLKIPMHERSGQWQLAAGALAVLFTLLQWHFALALALACTAFLCGVQLLDWKPLAVRRRPILWILYVGHACLGIGLLLAALHSLGLIERAAIHVHVLAIGGFSVLIVGMMTRTALGHLGRPLVLDRMSKACYCLMLAAFVLRLIALALSNASWVALQLAAVAWIGAFALYLWRFVPMMIRPVPERGGPAKVLIKRS
ncbi:NnrS protein [Variovorax sp. SRS16]|uniref:NnrS family protein n=1 Tax=Variovorax sp. SRS16 TaxID=282217 RepID=UPI0013166A4E|nr:NnrS family protein [Variovorax sp. SRS16]VTU24804.1 NnrS protein [Variovorax sp. SRS16]